MTTEQLDVLLELSARHTITLSRYVDPSDDDEEWNRIQIYLGSVSLILEEYIQYGGIQWCTHKNLENPYELLDHIN